MTKSDRAPTGRPFSHGAGSSVPTCRSCQRRPWPGRVSQDGGSWLRSVRIVWPLAFGLPWAICSRRLEQDGAVANERGGAAVAAFTEAMAYADWLSQQTGQSYRLPSAAEWQYAARAGSTEAVHVDDSDPHRMDVCGRANVFGYRVICQ